VISGAELRVWRRRQTSRGTRSYSNNDNA
jgi:hypothetical protein